MFVVCPIVSCCRRGVVAVETCFFLTGSFWPAAAAFFRIFSFSPFCCKLLTYDVQLLILTYIVSCHWLTVYKLPYKLHTCSIDSTHVPCDLIVGRSLLARQSVKSDVRITMPMTPGIMVIIIGPCDCCKKQKSRKCRIQVILRYLLFQRNSSCHCKILPASSCFDGRLFRRRDKNWCCQ